MDVNGAMLADASKEKDEPRNSSSVNKDDEDSDEDSSIRV